MKVIIVKNYEEASQEAAKIFINQVKENPQSIPVFRSYHYIF